MQLSHLEIREIAKGGGQLMTEEQQAYVQVGKDFAEAVTALDVAKLAAVLTDDFIMVYNFENKPRPRKEFLETVTEVYAALKNRRDDDLRILPTPEGFVLQATLRAEYDGQDVERHYCVVAKVANGKIQRCDDYFDQSGMATRVDPNANRIMRVDL
jgi:ketosteroid isomerase-like protein